VDPAPAIPDHTLLRPIGRGAYGEVWLARSVMGTFRAVKIIRQGQFDSARPFERELAGIQRYEPVSRSSGGLVHVLHVGKNDAEGYFYYVMELADDASGAVHNESKPGSEADGTIRLDAYKPRTLRSELKRLGRLPTADCLRLAIDVASGLGHLHRQGLVHRDVKPGNIIFVNHRGKLADIGLVTAQGEGRTFVGTEGYIPPEGPGTTAADLYALGVVLYEASTGFSPDRLPDIPAEWLAERGGDEALEFIEIILKACEGERKRRYASVEPLQADLALLQSGQSVRRARTLERRYATLRQCGWAGAILLVIALLAALFASYRARQAAENDAREIALRRQAEDSRARAESAERQAHQQLYNALLEQARATVRSGELGQREHALDAIRTASAISNTAELRGAALAALALPDWRLERQWPITPDTTLIQFDPDFKRFALGHGDGAVEIRSASDQRLLATLSASTNLPAYFARWSPDGQFLAVKRDWPGPGSYTADLEVWQVAQQRRVFVVHAVKYDAVAFDPHRPRLMAALPDRDIAVWNMENGGELQRFKLRRIPAVLAISPDGGRFAAGYDIGTDGTSAVTVHSAADGALRMSCPLKDTVGGINWSPDGKWVATADYSGAVQLLDTETGQPHLLGRHAVQAVQATFTPDGDYLLTAGWEREFIVWDMRRMERALTIGLNSYRAQLRSDGGECAIVTYTNVQLHAVERPVGCRDIAGDLGLRVLHAAFSIDAHWLAAEGTERLGVWDLTRRDLGVTVPEGANARLFFSRQGDLFASEDHQKHRWHVAPGAGPDSPPQLLPAPLSEPPGFSSVCAVSNLIVVTCQRGSYALDPSGETATEPHWTLTANGVTAGSPDGPWLGVFAPFSTVLHIYRPPGFQPVATLTNRANIGAVEFSPQGDELAVGTPRALEIWSTSTWRRLRQLDYMGLLYAPDMPALWLARDYRNAGLYDAKSLDLLLPLPVGMFPLAISRDGRFLAVSRDTQRLQLLDLAEIKSHFHELGLTWPAPNSPQPRGIR